MPEVNGGTGKRSLDPIPSIHTDDNDSHRLTYLRQTPPREPTISIRVLQIIHQGQGAGSVLSTLHLSIGLARRGIGVVLACPSGSELETQARDAGLEVRPTAFASSRFSNAGTLSRLLNGLNVDLVNSQGGRDRAALAWLGLRGGLSVPLVLTRRQMPRAFWLDNWLASRVATRTIAVSPSVADRLVRLGTPRGKISVVPNGLIVDRVDRAVSAEQLEAWRVRIGWDSSRRTVAIVARPKAQATVLRALATVRTPVRLVLAGAGESAFLAERRAIPERHAVVSLPFLPDVRPLYDLVDLALLPSRDEGLSQALLEAMALAKPVIASDVPGNAFVVREGENGLLCPVDDGAAWATSIDRVLGDSALSQRLGAAARRTARDEFTLERTIDGTIQVYRSVLGLTD